MHNLPTIDTSIVNVEDKRGHIALKYSYCTYNYDPKELVGSMLVPRILNHQ
ncbi:hypothetical protein CAAN1_12S01376 [[Candida] anglica]|uniref:Uncharacterized protein n=1 Tax=[Candida] anglica TaxID=148631 RepID=A0ABP0EBH9_9ASCO